MNMDVILGLARHILTTAGGFLVAKGYIDSASLEAGVGALLTIVGVAMSWRKNKAIGA